MSQPERPGPPADGGGLDRLLEAARAGTLYGASLPERTLRAMIGAAGGIVRESARAAVPDALKGSKLYEITVRKMLRFLVEDVGGLEGAATEGGGAAAGPAPSPPAGAEYVAKKAIGNAIDIAGLAALHLSPLWVIAVASDVIHGARTYLNALGDELRRTGVIAADTRFEGVDGLLAALGKVSGTVADHLDTPPVTLAELKKMVADLRAVSKEADLKSLVPQEQIDSLWRQIQETARLEGRTPFEVSNAVAVMIFAQMARVGRGAAGSVKVGLDLLHESVVSYYFDSLAQLREKGYYQALADATGPYLDGLRHLFEPSRESWTEKLLTGKAFRALWAAIVRRCRRRRGGNGASGDREAGGPP